jgi:hypothetical protein
MRFEDLTTTTKTWHRTDWSRFTNAEKRAQWLWCQWFGRKSRITRVFWARGVTCNDVLSHDDTKGQFYKWRRSDFWCIFFPFKVIPVHSPVSLLARTGSKIPSPPPVFLKVTVTSRLTVSPCCCRNLVSIWIVTFFGFWGVLSDERTGLPLSKDMVNYIFIIIISIYALYMNFR